MPTIKTKKSNTLQNKDYHPYRKKWGQNFLRDTNIITKIVACLNPKISDVILEIGPGDGAITDQLCKQTSKIHVVEIDPLLVKILEEKEYQNVIVHQNDILTWKTDQLPNGIKIIGNLPYYISSPILFHFLKINIWERMVFMFQKELAQRIISPNGNKLYGRISVMCQIYCDVSTEFNVSRNVFQPKPKVDSCVLSFYPKNIDVPNIIPFSKFIKQAFSQRRKKLRNNIPQECQTRSLNKWEDKRPEEISPKEYIEIYNRIYLG